MRRGGMRSKFLRVGSVERHGERHGEAVEEPRHPFVVDGAVGGDVALGMEPELVEAAKEAPHVVAEERLAAEELDAIEVREELVEVGEERVVIRHGEPGARPSRRERDARRTRRGTTHTRGCRRSRRRSQLAWPVGRGRVRGGPNHRAAPWGASRARREGGDDEQPCEWSSASMAGESSARIRDHARGP